MKEKIKKYVVVVGIEIPTIPIAFFNNFIEAGVFFKHNLSVFKNEGSNIWVKRFEEVKHLF